MAYLSYGLKRTSDMMETVLPWSKHSISSSSLKVKNYAFLCVLMNEEPPPPSMFLFIMC